jgi:hypothetical protein
MRPLVLLALTIATPAVAQSQLNPAQIGNAFCAALVSGDRTAFGPLLTPELAGLTAGRDDVRWHSGDATPVACMPVGAGGSADHPESVLFLTFPGGKTASDRLILNFVADQLRIDDVAYDRSGTLREMLASRDAED